MAHPETPDRRTTPPWLRGPGLALLMVLALYNVTAFHFTMGPSPRWVVPAYWQMFTKTNKGCVDMEAEALVNGEWTAIDMDALFPTRWESGDRPGFPGIRSHKSRRRIMAASTCLRHPDQPQKLRFFEVRWQKKLGTLKRINERRTPLMDWNCDTKVRLPNGKVIP